MIDSDHKHLIEIINKTNLALNNKNHAELTIALVTLAKYAVLHFAREEKIAAAVGYGKVSQLHASHENLLVKLELIKQEIGEVWTEELAEHFGALLRDWVVNHVIKEDMLMKPYLKKFSPRLEPR